MKKFKLLKGFTGRQIEVREINEPTFDIPVQFEPMRQNRFNVKFPEEFQIPDYFVRMSSRPTAIYENGLTTWDDMTFVLYDPIAPSIGRLIYNLMGTEELYRPITITLQMLDPTGVVVSEWSIYGAISSVDFSNLDYSHDFITDVTLNMRVYHAILNF